MDAPSPTPIPEGPRFSPISSDDHAGYVWIISVLCLIYSTLALVVRGHVKWKLYGLDDWFIVVATATQLGQVVALFVALQNGMGKSQELVSIAHLLKAAKATYVSQIFFILSLCFAKCSVFCLLLRLITRSRQRSWASIVACLVLAGVWGLASILALSIQCSARAFITDFADSTCNDQLLRWKLIVAFDVITEMIIVLPPIPIVWPLQKMTLKKKFYVWLAFAFRIPVAILALVHLHYAADYVNTKHTSLMVVPALSWQQVELCWSILSATIPNLRSFMKSFSSGFSLEFGLSSGRYGMGSYGNHSYRLGSIKTNASQTPAPRTSSPHNEPDKLAFANNLRPEPVDCVATVNHEGRVDAKKGNMSIMSDGSEEMMIRKDVAWDVQSEQVDRL